MEDALEDTSDDDELPKYNFRDDYMSADYIYLSTFIDVCNESY